MTSLYYGFTTVYNLVATPQIPDGVKNMYECFYENDELKTVTNIPNSVEDISACFTLCPKLENCPDLPDSVTNLTGTFWGCTRLKNIPKLPMFVANMDRTFYGCSSLAGDVVIPDTVISMESCFDGTKITSAKVSKNVTTLRECFKDCTELVNVETIPEDVIDIYSCFDGCTSLKTITDWRLCNKDVIISDYGYNPRKSIFNNVNSIELIEVENYASEIINKWLVNQTNPAFNVDDVIRTPDGNNIVPFSKLGQVVSCLPTNTVETAYKLNITGLTKNDLGDAEEDINSLGHILNGNIYFDLSDTNLPNDVTTLEKTFSAVCLVKSPVIPNSVTSMKGTFEYTNLVETPVIPEGVTDMQRCFNTCKYLETVKNIPSTAIDLEECFFGCINLKEISFWNVNTQSTLVLSNFNDMVMDSIYTENTEKEMYLEKQFNSQVSQDVRTIVKALDDGVPLSILDEWLQWQLPNTVDTPYDLRITGLNNRNLYNLNVLRNHKDKYINLEKTTLPESIDYDYLFNSVTSLVYPPAFPEELNFEEDVVSLSGVFSDCVNLKKAPILPICKNGAYLSDIFNGCSSLVDVPIIKTEVTDIFNGFRDCSSLEVLPNFPKVYIDVDYPEGSSESINWCFYGCSKLTTILDWEMTVEETSMFDMTDCFYGCTNLTDIYVKDTEPAVSQDNSFKEYRMELDSENHKAVVTQFTATEIAGRSTERYAKWTQVVPYGTSDILKLFYGTDELTVGDNSAISPEKMEMFMRYKVPFATHTISSQILNPAVSNFVIWANDPNEVKCNFLDVSVKMDDSEFDYVFREE